MISSNMQRLKVRLEVNHISMLKYIEIE